MNESVRPSSAFAPGLSINAPSGVLATIPNPPPEITRLPNGTAVRGVVVGDDGHGHVLVKTDLGTLSVATKAHLAPDTEVILQLRSSGAQLHALIMQARTQTAAARVPPSPLPAQPSTPTATPTDSASTGGAPTGSAPSGGGPSAGAAQAATPPSVAPHWSNLGQFVRAVVQGPPAGNGTSTGTGAESGTGRVVPGPAGPFQVTGPASTATLSPLPPGTPLQVRILSVSPPAVSQPTGESLPAASTPGTGPGVPTASPSVAGPNPAQIIAAGTESPKAATTGQISTPAPAPVFAGASGPVGPQSSHHPAMIQSVPGTLSAGFTTTGPGGRAVPTPQVVNGPQVVTGQIVGATHAGHPVISTPLGTLTLEVRASLPTGGSVNLEVPGEPLPTDTAVESRLSAPRSLAHAWPALEQALEALRDLPAPSGVAPTIPHTVPQPGPRLASGVLFVLAALTGGDIGAWLGADTMQALRAAGRGGLIDRLTRDLGQMRRMGEGVGSDWRLLPIPLWDGGQVRQVRLFLRQRNKREGKKPGDDREPTRFILELEMSRLGEMQFDGLVRAKRFDLMLRTRAPLPPQMREDIRQIFQDANDAAGYAGSLGFQASRDWHFVPVEQPGTSPAESSLLV